MKKRSRRFSESTAELSSHALLSQVRSPSRPVQHNHQNKNLRSHFPLQLSIRQHQRQLQSRFQVFETRKPPRMLLRFKSTSQLKASDLPVQPAIRIAIKNQIERSLPKKEILDTSWITRTKRRIYPQVKRKSRREKAKKGRRRQVYEQRLQMRKEGKQEIHQVRKESCLRRQVINIG
ncbi:hypothetical protein LZ554_004719 [Drepanopeziza brunnea f. sp. 'monogermtubi']|nr:hypothetical protein LZ554_004719 [Drepanopeziza brunnea f. sp. 'monogermtubi']